jgi:predicted nucleic acid-binding protein
LIVVDTDVIGYLFLTSARSASAERALERDQDWAAPLLWRTELRSVFSLYVRKAWHELGQAMQSMESAASLMRGGEYDVPSGEVLRLAAESGCTAYDCEFVALARDLRVPLVTADRQLLDAFPGVAVSLEVFCR